MLDNARLRAWRVVLEPGEATGEITQTAPGSSRAASMTVPAGFTADDLPVGITFFGRPYSEPLLLKLSYSYEQATLHRRPPETTPALVNANGDASASR